MHRRDPLFQYINSQDIIRIIIDYAPNFGNQSANYNLIMKLRQLGFRGLFEIIYFKEAKNKIFQLFNLPADTHYFEDYGLKFIEVSDFLNQQPVSIGLGLSGAIDALPSKWKMGIEHGNFATALNVESFVRFSPYYFFDDDLCDTEIYFKNNDTVITQHNSCSKMLITPIATLANTKEFLFNTNTGNTLIDQYPGLTNLIEMIEDKAINFQSIYGWTLRESPSNLLNILLGSRYAQIHGPENLQKPLVIGAFFNLNGPSNYKSHHGDISNRQILEFLIYEDDWEVFDSLPGAEQIKNAIRELKFRHQFKIIELQDPHSIECLKKLNHHDILLLTFPSLPKTVFDGLFTYHASNVLPPVREGASSLTSLLSGVVKPHIHCRPRIDWEINLNLANPDLQKELMELNDNICKEDFGGDLNFVAWKTYHIGKMIGNYIIQATFPDSPVSLYFQRLQKEALLPENDRILNDLSALVTIIQGQMTNLISYTKSTSLNCVDKILASCVSYANGVVNECPSYFSSSQVLWPRPSLSSTPAANLMTSTCQASAIMPTNNYLQLK